MKSFTTFFITLFVLTTSAFAHNGVEHGTEHIEFFHIAHYILLFGGIAACLVVIYRERKELFGKK